MYKTLCMYSRQYQSLKVLCSYCITEIIIKRGFPFFTWSPSSGEQSSIIAIAIIGAGGLFFLLVVTPLIGVSLVVSLIIQCSSANACRHDAPIDVTVTITLRPAPVSGPRPTLLSNEVYALQFVANQHSLRVLDTLWVQLFPPLARGSVCM